jgi:hypothetical protein
MASCIERGANIQAWQLASYRGAQQANETCGVTLKMVGSLHLLYSESYKTRSEHPCSPDSKRMLGTANNHIMVVTQ